MCERKYQIIIIRWDDNLRLIEQLSDHYVNLIFVYKPKWSYIKGRTTVPLVYCVAPIILSFFPFPIFGFSVMATTFAAVPLKSLVVKNATIDNNPTSKKCLVELGVLLRGSKLAKTTAFPGFLKRKCRNGAAALSATVKDNETLTAASSKVFC